MSFWLHFLNHIAVKNAGNISFVWGIIQTVGHCQSIRRHWQARDTGANVWYTDHNRDNGRDYISRAIMLEMTELINIQTASNRALTGNEQAHAPTPRSRWYVQKI